jgi:hypothetical protein
MVVYVCICTYHSRFIPEGVAEHLKYSSETPTLYDNYLVMRKMARRDRWQAHRRLFVVYLRGNCAINPLVAFYDIHGRKGEVLLFSYIPDTTQDIIRVN